MANNGMINEVLSERQKLHENPTGSDITVCYGGNDFILKIPAHKEILSHYSGYFKRMFANTPTMRQIYLPDDFKTVADMLRHFYDLPPGEDAKRTAVQDIALWNIAHDFEVPSLISSSEASIAYQLRATVGGTFLFVEVIHAIYQAAPRQNSSLRGIALQVCGENFRDLCMHQKFQRVMIENPVFAVDLAVLVGRVEVVKQEV